jgi:signal transduction histidine kinase
MDKNPHLPPSGKEPRPKLLATIRGRLFLLLLAVLVPIFVVQASIYYDRFRFERGQGSETNLELARAVAENLQHFIRDVSHQELAIGLALTSPNPLPPQQVNRLLVESEKEYEAVRDFTWVDAQGRVVASSLKSAVHADLSDRSYFREIAGGSETAVSDLMIAKVTGRPIFTISRRIRDEKGEFLGAVVAVVEPDLLGDMLAFRRAHEGAIGIVDRNGIGVTRYPEIKWTWKERSLLDRFPLIRKALEGKEITFITPYSLDGTERILACVPIPSIGWAAAASVPVKAVTAPVISNLFYHAAWFLLVSSAAIMFALIISRRISIPVKNLRDQALALGRGELNHRVEARGMKEMEDLAQSFNTMAEEIRARQMQVEERAKALDEAHSRIRDILNSVTDGFMSVSRDFKFSYVNDAGAKFLGRSGGDIIGKPVFDAFPEAEGTVFEECFRKGLEQRAILSFEDFYPPLESWFECRCYPSPDGISIFFTDTTLRRHFEQERERLLAERDQTASELEAVINALSEGLSISDLEGNVLDMNRAALRLHGYADVAEIRRHMGDFPELFELRDPNGRVLPTNEWPLALALRGTACTDLELRVRRKDTGVERIWLYGAAPVYNRAGDPVLAIVTMHDITELKQAQWELRKANEELEQRVQQRTAELQRANEALQARANDLQMLNTELQDFAFVASHDLKEPLRKIQTLGSLLRGKHHDQLGDHGRDYLFRMEAAAYRMQSLLEALLSYSRITTKGRPFQPVELNDVVGEAAIDLELVIQKAEARLDVAPLPTVNGDRHQLRQLFQNLIANAIKFRFPAVDPEVKIYSRSMDNAHQIFIEDNGIGFAEKYMDLIFKPFQRLHGRGEYEGTGMGLAICRKIMERHGGKISVNSIPGKGSIFQVTFPITKMRKAEQETE